MDALVTSDLNDVINKYILDVTIIWNGAIVLDLIGNLLMVPLKWEMHRSYLLVLKFTIVYVV